MRAILGGVGLPCVPARPACCCCRLLRTACGARRKENPAAREWCELTAWTCELVIPVTCVHVLILRFLGRVRARACAKAASERASHLSTHT